MSMAEISDEANAGPHPSPCDSDLGIHGVRLKHFEQVVASLLPSVQPSYVRLPPIPDEEDMGGVQDDLLDWPFSQLPCAARVLGSLPGQLKDPTRAARKEGQLRSMLRCIFWLMPSHIKNNGETITTDEQQQQQQQQQQTNEPFTIVDVGGGSGHLGIPVALLLPHCRVVVIELRSKSLDFLHEKAKHVIEEVLAVASSSKIGKLCRNRRIIKAPAFLSDSRFRAAGRNGVLENLFSFHGPIEDYLESFDMALALHLCGQATDVTLRRAASIHASYIVAAPCCVGKLSQKVRNPNVYHATGTNLPTVQYPQSSLFCGLIQRQDDWDALAKAADYSDMEEFRTSRNATRRTAKALLETDRRIFLEEECGYSTAMVRMDPWEVTPKNDIILAWRKKTLWQEEEDEQDPQSRNVVTPTRVALDSDEDCFQDIRHANFHLVASSTGTLDQESSTRLNGLGVHVDWTLEEESTVRAELQKFLEKNADTGDRLEEVLIFPTRMGKRMRKLIHYVAGQMDLAHWSEGKLYSEKTVAVSRRGRGKRM